MKKVIVFLCAFMSLLCLSADDFTDFTKTANDVMKSFKAARASREGSSMYLDFTEQLKKLEEQSVAINEHIKKLELGNDFEFTYYIDQIKLAFKAKDIRKDYEKAGGTLLQIIDPDIVFDFMKQDLKTLKEMDFEISPEGVASINKTYLEFREFLRYKRLFDYMVEQEKNLSKKASSFSWRKAVERRIPQFVDAGDKLDAILKKNSSEYASKLSLARETRTMENMLRRMILTRDAKGGSKLEDMGSKYVKKPDEEFKYSMDKISPELKAASDELASYGKKKRPRRQRKGETETKEQEKPSVLVYYSVDGKLPEVPEKASKRNSRNKNADAETEEEVSAVDAEKTTAASLADFDKIVSKYRSHSNVMLNGLSDDDAEKFILTLNPKLKNEFAAKVSSELAAGKSQSRANGSAYLAIQLPLKKAVFTNAEKMKILEDIKSMEQEDSDDDDAN